MLSELTSVFRQNAYESEFDTPHMIVTYTALVSLAILRDDFARLDRGGLVTFLRSSQQEDGRFVFSLPSKFVGLTDREVSLQIRRGVTQISV